MYRKTIVLLVICGCALAAPTPKVNDQQQFRQPKTDSSFKTAGNVINEMETSLDGIDQMFIKKSFLSGNNKRIGLLNQDIGALQPLINEGDFIPAILPLPQDDDHFRAVKPRDRFVGSEAAAARAIDSPLFFDTFEHGHMVTDYAERRNSPLLLRSIRPDFPFSDISNRRRVK